MQGEKNFIMERSAPLEPISGEVYRKIGRNVVLFQKLEAMLKILAYYSNISGYASDIKKKHEQLIASVDRQTLGQVKKQVFETVFSGAEEISAPEKLAAIWVDFNFKIVMDLSQCNAFEESLAWAVLERNELIHQLVLKFDLHSPQDADAAIEYLDRQYEKILPIHAEVLFYARGLSDLLKERAACFEDEEFVNSFYERLFPMLPYVELLIALLSDIALQRARPDGWTELSVAGQIIRQKIPDELSALREYYSKRTLKELLLSIRSLEVYEEPTSKGGIRVLYRKKPQQT